MKEKVEPAIIGRMVNLRPPDSLMSTPDVEIIYFADKGGHGKGIGGQEESSGKE